MQARPPMVASWLTTQNPVKRASSRMRAPAKTTLLIS
ncbi:Uncharacterised protein [Klebsiella pneumoniae]|uniref:Uncharacterized protein n=1 Tax=Klebsiella pneumoniae TaxID=573 RepID=A0A2X3E342_KLEPN|nr:Uncharacterised protein [Klebsiella pneumoniae]